MGRHPSRRHVTPQEAPIGRRIRQRRKDLGLTQAGLTGGEYTKSFISQLEHGDADPSLDTLRFLSRRLATSLSALAGDVQDQRLAAVEGLLLWAREAAGAGNGALARRILRLAADLADTAGWELHHAEARLAVAEFEAEHGDAATAESLLVGATDLAASLGTRGLARKDLAAGRLALRRGDGAAAVSSFHAALAGLRKTARHPDLAALALLGLAAALHRTGDLKNSGRRLAAAAKLADRYRLDSLHGRALLYLGLLRRQEGAAEEAVHLLQEAEGILDQTEDREAHLEVLIQRGRMLLDAGDDAGALEVARRAASLADGSLNSAAARASSIAARALLRQRANQALPMLAQAVEQLQTAGSPDELAEAANDMSAHYRSRGEHALADRYRAIASRGAGESDAGSASPEPGGEAGPQEGSRRPLSSSGT